jgi:hypothetical protein
MSTTHEGIIAVEASQAAGLITWWTLGGTTPLEALSEAWGAAGLSHDELPAEPSDRAALKRALEAVWPEHSVSPLKGGGYAVVQLVKGEHAEGRDPKINTLAKCWLDTDDTLLLWMPEEADPVGVMRAEKRKEVWKALQKSRDELDPVDVSQWLIAQAYNYAGIALRQTGGIYFVPNVYAAAWRTLTAVLESVNKRVTVYEVPAMRTDKAVGAILAALQSDVETELTRIQEALDRSNEDKLGARALATRKTIVEELTKKVRQYEALLGANLDVLREQAESMDGKIARAIMAEMDV